MPQPNKFWNRLEGKVAIVTGAGSQGSGFGIGRAVACTLAREGARVVLVDRELGAIAEETRALIVAEGGTALACAADVTDGAACAQVVAAAVAAYGGIDILVNNVGIATSRQPIGDLDENVWQRVMDVNLKSAVLMCKHAVPHMIRARGWRRRECLFGGQPDLIRIDRLCRIQGSAELTDRRAGRPARA